MKSFEIPIVFCSDQNFTDHVAVTIISICESNPTFQFNFHLLSSDPKKYKIKKLEKLCLSLRSNLTVHIPDFSIFQDLPEVHHLKKSSYFRLLIPQLIHDNRILYLDSDILCLDDLSPFLELDLASFPIAAVADPVYKWNDELGMQKDSVYFNSGMMLINRDSWLENKVTKKSLEFIRSNPDKIKFADQCGLNAVLDGKYLELSPKFNQQAILYRSDVPKVNQIWNQDEILDALNQPILIHFTGSSKPWQYQNAHPQKSLYWTFQKKSPFKRKFPDGMGVMGYIKSFFPKRLKRKLKDLINSAHR